MFFLENEALIFIQTKCMHPFLNGLKKILNHHYNATNAAAQKAYMLNQFEHMGIVAAQRRKLSKEYFKSGIRLNMPQVIVVVKKCFEQPEREFHYAAVELLAFYKKSWREDTIELIEYCLVTKSWWDSVDHVASECLGNYFRLFPQKVNSVTGRWNQSVNIWLQRSSIMFQKSFKLETDTDLLAKYILQVKDSDEFFIRKAIGWALREYAKTNPDWVKKFVNSSSLHSLSKREALKRL